MARAIVDIARPQSDSFMSLGRYLNETREEERASIARELHDQMGQLLTKLKMDLHCLLPHLPARLQLERGHSMDALVDQLIETVQGVSARLHPSVLEQLGLEAAIEDEIDAFSERYRCTCRLEIELRNLKNTDLLRDTVCFRVLQEALANIARHAGAHLVCVRLFTLRGQLCLLVEDDGVGIDERSIAKGFGLRSMRERAAALGGTVDVRQRVEGGTRVTLKIPVIARRSA
jgi:signal transduction histidine kinase